MPKIKKDIGIILTAFAIIALTAIVRVTYHDGFVPDWDESHHLWMGYKYYFNFVTGNIAGILNLFFYSDQIYPPFYHWSIAVSYLLFDVRPRVAAYANSVFLLIFMLSIYGISLNAGARKTGLYASVLTPLLPLFLSLQERALIDYASAGMFMATIYFLLKTDNFRNSKYATVLGIMIALDLLVKWPFIIPALPFVLYGIDSFIVYKKDRELILSNISTAFLISLTGLIWYVFNYKYMVVTLNFFWRPDGFAQEIWGFPKGFTLDNILLYLYDFPSSVNGVGSVVLIFFLIFLLKPARNRFFSLMKYSVLFTYLVLTFLDDKSSFYLVYTYPLLMVITVSGILQIKNTILKRILLFVFSGVIILNFLLTFNNGKSYKQYAIIKSHMFSFLPNYGTKFRFPDWPTKQFVFENLTIEKCEGGVLVFPDHRFFSFPNIRYFLTTFNRHLPITQAYLYHNPATDDTFNTSTIDGFDCIVSKTGDPGMFANSKVLEFVNSYLSEHPEYRQIRMPAPEKSELILFYRN